MLKKTFILSLLMVACCLSVGTNVGWATPSLGGWWNEGDLGSTHQRWDFTANHVKKITGDGYTADPEEVSNPEPTFVIASISSVPFAGKAIWDTSDKIVSSVGIYGFSGISVNLEIPNYGTLNPYKEIWVDIGNNVVTDDSIAISAGDDDHPSGYYSYEILSMRGDAEFGVRIWPNPEVEKIGFAIFTVGASTVLDYIHVDTICIPEPATMALLGLGALSLLRSSRRRPSRSRNRNVN